MTSILVIRKESVLVNRPEISDLAENNVDFKNTIKSVQNVFLF